MERSEKSFYGVKRPQGGNPESDRKREKQRKWRIKEEGWELFVRLTKGLEDKSALGKLEEGRNKQKIAEGVFAWAVEAVEDNPDRLREALKKALARRKRIGGASGITEEDIGVMLEVAQRRFSKKVEPIPQIWGDLGVGGGKQREMMRVVREAVAWLVGEWLSEK